MKILTVPQIQALDRFTIEQEPISSIQLMERAALTFTYWFVNRFPDTRRRISIFCGPGNNGGDGLAVARMLHQRFYDVSVYFCKISPNTSDDFKINRERLPAFQAIDFLELEENAPMPGLPTNGILIDAIFGSGLNRPVEGYWAQLLQHLNEQPGIRVSIDIPSGMYAGQPTEHISVEAHYTFSFELPKLAFFFPENMQRVGDWQAESIGLHPKGIEQADTPYYYLCPEMLHPMLKRRKKYDHKGVFGHALLLMGSQGKVGAAILASRACLRAGAGLVTVHAPKCAYEILQISIPEAMVSIDRHQYYLSEIPKLEGYAAIGIGCGLDKKKTSREAFHELLRKAGQPLLIDADALNILGKKKEWLPLIPEGSILTPHPKEFERLFGATSDSFERNRLQREKARELGLIIVLKGAHTCIAAPDGRCFFNSTGNPGMATAGSGDVLSGILAGLLSQGYSPLESAMLGVYLHGLAGDLAAEAMDQESLIAGEITAHLGKAFHRLRAGTPKD